MVLAGIDSAQGSASPVFTTTRWTVVRMAADRDGSTSEARLAWERLCQSYWLPLYIFARRRCLDLEEAKDAVQDFFLHLLENQVVERADRERGRFRTFLLGCFCNFLADRGKRALTIKRGGQLHFVSLEELDLTELEQQAAAQNWTPESAYDIGWAHTLVERVVGKLRREAEGRGKRQWFDELRVFLPHQNVDQSGHGDEADLYQNAAARLGVAVETLRMTVHRLRARFRSLVREEVVATVDMPDEVDAELRHLRATLSLAYRMDG